MILLASNSRTVLLQLERLCLQHQLATCCATDLAQARRLLARNQVEALVLDDWFPDGRGADLTAEVRAAGKDLPVIAIGTQAGMHADKLSGAAAADAVVSKADLISTLPHQLDRLLQQRRGRASLGRVLVVDDSPTYRNQLRLSLEAAGYTVVLAETGEEGVRCAFENPPDALLVDSILPGISGAQVVRRIRGESSTRRTPCLLLTASEDAGQELEALEAGADTFVRKDEQIAVILARLAGVLRSTSTPAATSLTALPQLPRRVALIGAASGSGAGALASAGRVLLEEGAETFTLTPAQATLDHCERLQPDVLLYEAPVNEALLAFCRAFRGIAALRNSRLLLLDTIPARNEAVAAIQAGADDYLPAGSESSIVLARLKSHLRRKRVEDENRGLREHILRAELETEAQRSLADARSRHADEMRVAYGMAEQKAQEAERARLELEQITEGIPQIVWTSDADGRNAQFNRRWTDYTGLPNRSVTDGVWRRAIHQEDRVRALRHWMQSFKGGLPYTSEYRLRSKADEYRWFLVRAIPLNDETGSIDRWFGTCTDIHDQKLSEEALRRTEKLAATGRLAASIAHEINNPLEAVTNLLYLIEGSVRHDDETHGYVTIAQKELDRVAQISKKTLAFYRESTQAAEVDLCGLVSEVLEIYSVRLERKRIALNVEEDCDRKPMGLAGELRQVISNLVTNAIDASPDASSLRIRIRGAHRWDSGALAGVRISVGDQGHGIPASLQADIFKPFVTTKGQKGTGLGLWLSHSIMERHGGSMRLRSCTGARHGTCFSLFLPMQYQGTGRDVDSMGTMLRTIGKELLGQA